MISVVRRTFIVFALVGALVGCSAPTDQYPKLSSDGLYFKVPRSWSEVPENVLATFEAKNTDQAALDRLAVVRWQAAYAPSRVSASQVFSAKPSDLPIVYIRVRDLYTDERDAVSLNTLRDAIFPITKWSADPTLAHFTSLLDEELSFKGGAGVHERYSFSQDSGALQVVDQSALLSPDRNTLYLLVVRCSESCFQKNQKAIEAISASLVVRGARG
ncbi:unannotated protein [freshwater metagenome]|uniref:Unannotated protein n=1 Tax=freshwater metagenome TaxID=449393 RepID=A0A6J6M4W4_9ZZZZ|nr:hypothetical protein [Actinomycetota bacterium]MSY51877.1 hypothetical protein [Actinomycetota bacterium]MSY87073.1 hypothetical protein [Actinomycetota bacterium]MTA50781.1 hypothetical protein [Actinomycetota bacterium]